MDALTFRRFGFPVAVLLLGAANNARAQVLRILLRNISIMALALSVVVLLLSVSAVARGQGALQNSTTSSVWTPGSGIPPPPDFAAAQEMATADQEFARKNAHGTTLVDELAQAEKDASAKVAIDWGAVDAEIKKEREEKTRESENRKAIDQALRQGEDRDLVLAIIALAFIGGFAYLVYKVHKRLGWRNLARKLWSAKRTIGVLSLGFAVLVTLLNPPWTIRSTYGSSVEWVWLFAPPRSGSIDLGVLFIELAAISVVSVVLYLLFWGTHGTRKAQSLPSDNLDDAARKKHSVEERARDLVE